MKAYLEILMQPVYYLEILMQPVYQRRNLGSLWMTKLLLGLAILFPLLGLLGKKAMIVGFVAAAVALGLTVFMWWGMFIYSAMRQNSPSLAALTPHLRQRLIRVTALLWLIASGCFASMLALAIGHFGFILIGMGAFMLLEAATKRFRWLGYMPFLAILFMHTGPTSWPSYITACINYVGEPMLALLGVCLLLLAGAMILQLIYPRSGDQHWKWHGAMLKRMEFRKAGLPRSTDSSFYQWNIFSPRFSYAKALQRACARHAPAGRLLMFVLGPNCRWSCFPLISFVLFILALLTRLFGVDTTTFMHIGTTPAIVFSMVPCAAFTNIVANWIYETRTEQGILLLAPGMPGKAQLNRLLANNLLTQFLRGWLVITVYLMLAGFIVGGRFAELVDIVSIATVALPIAPFLLHNYAAQPGCNDMQMNALFILSIFLVFGACFAVQKLWYPVLWPVFGMAFVVIALVIGAIRWQRMMASPPAFPAGRPCA